MSFKINNYEQINLDDNYFNLTKREQNALDNSWASVFADELFPMIDEKPFSVLYSEKDSRPNTPVNVIIGALIIKEMFDYSDDEIVEGCMLDLRIQTALHTTSFKEQPLSDKTLSRFRKRCYDYEKSTGVDLYHDCMVKLGSEIAKVMKISGRLRRMDSMMVDSNIRKLSRMELIYSCVRKLAVLASKTDENLLPEELKHYLDPNDFNRIFYYQRSSETGENTVQLLSDADQLIELCKASFSGSIEYGLLERCLSEQTVVEGEKRRLRTKEDGGMNSSILQNPSDPDATYREKAKKQHRGYVANLEESVGKAGTVVTDYDFDQNTHSDSKFLEERLEEIGHQDEETTYVADGAYSGTEIKAIAQENNVAVVTTELSGRETPDVMADFELNEEGSRVLKCPAGNEPTKCSYSASNKRITASFARSQCEFCEHREECRAKLYKKTAQVFISRAAHERALSQRFTKSEKFKNYARLRNGVETLPSYIRRRLHLDKLPRGKQRAKFFFGSKVSALNFRKLFNYRRGEGNYAQNPVIG